MTDPITLLRGADPAVGLTRTPPADLRERILADPGAATPPPRRARRRRVAAGLAGAAALAAAIVVAAPWAHPASPDVIARAADAYAKPNAVVHFRLRLARGVHVQPLADTDETWQTVDSRRERTVTGKGLQFAEDYDARTLDFYKPGADAVERQNPVDAPVKPPGTLGNADGSGTPHVGDVAALLEQARDGHNGLRLVGETTVRGIPVYELELTSTNTSGTVRATSLGLIGAGQQLTRTIYLDRDSYLPVRLVETTTGIGGPPATATADFLGIERLSGPAADAQLKLHTPPGTPVHVRPPFDDSKANGAP